MRRRIPRDSRSTSLFLRFNRHGASRREKGIIVRLPTSGRSRAACVHDRRRRRSSLTAVENEAQS